MILDWHGMLICVSPQAVSCELPAERPCPPNGDVIDAEPGGDATAHPPPPLPIPPLRTWLHTDVTDRKCYLAEDAHRPERMAGPCAGVGYILGEALECQRTAKPTRACCSARIHG
jgi:hypothetical protein